MKEQQIIRPREYESFERTQQNYFYAFEGGDSIGIRPLSVEIDSKTKYKKVYRYRKNWYYRDLPEDCLIVNSDILEEGDIKDYVKIEKNRIIVSRRDYCRVMGYSLAEQYDLWIRTEYTERIDSSFHDMFSKKIREGKGIEFLKNFYIPYYDIWFVDRYLEINDKVNLRVQYRDKLKANIISLETDYYFIVVEIEKLKKNIKKNETVLEGLEDTTGEELKVEKLLRQRERLMMRSLLKGIEDPDKMKKLDAKINKIMSSLGKVEEQKEALRMEILSKTETIEDNLRKLKEIKGKIWKIKELLEISELDLEDMLKDEELLKE